LEQCSAHKLNIEYNKGEWKNWFTNVEIYSSTGKTAHGILITIIIFSDLKIQNNKKSYKKCNVKNTENVCMGTKSIIFHSRNSANMKIVIHDKCIKEKYVISKLLKCKLCIRCFSDTCYCEHFRLSL
jgi:hypothetical protein